MNSSMPHSEPDLQLVEMLAGMNAAADLEVVQRTRRTVLLAAAEMRERRQRTRRNAAIALFTIVGLVMLLTPALWDTIDDVLSGGDFLEAHSMVMMLSLMLFSALLGALVVGLRSQRQIHHGRR
ncbi:MAG TPA: hypothetical protein VHB45_15890 [Alloacidobacterium sp.]|nr:hypothetical protein [Alloacidobacterium sp.]